MLNRLERVGFLELVPYGAILLLVAALMLKPVSYTHLDVYKRQAQLWYQDEEEMTPEKMAACMSELGF